MKLVGQNLDRVFMKSLSTIVVLMMLSTTTHAQTLDNTKIDILPDGIYATYITYVQGVPTNNMSLKKEYINRRAKKDKWMNGCFFHYKVNDQRIKAPFMIKKDEEVFIHTAFVRSKSRKWKKSRIDLSLIHISEPTRPY